MNTNEEANLEYITKTQFTAYRNVNEQKHMINDLKHSLSGTYNWMVLAGAIAVANGAGVYYGIQSGNNLLAGLCVV